MSDRQPARAIRFHPWVGSRYRSGGPWKRRLLVLGESHYSGNKREPRTLTQDLTLGYIHGRHSHPFWTRTAQVVTGEPVDRLDRSGFWNSVAFHNYVQEIVARSPRRAPTADAWRRSEQPFHEVLRALKPDVILVLGVRLWSWLPDTGRNESPITMDSRERDCYSYPTARGRRAMATFINHPSSFGFRWQDWHPVVERLLVSP